MGLIDNVNVNVGGNGNIIDTLSTYVTKLLKPNIVDGVNVLTQEMMSAQNTKYVIKYDFTLAEDITVPVNCILKFNGGSISGEHTITGNNTGIEAGLVKIFSTDVTLAGSWNVTEAYPEWFGGDKNNVDNKQEIQKCMDSPFDKILLSALYDVSGTLYINKDIYFKGSCDIVNEYANVNTNHVGIHITSRVNCLEFNQKVTFSAENILIRGFVDDYVHPTIPDYNYSGIYSYYKGNIKEIKCCTIQGFTYGIYSEGAGMRYILNSNFSACRFGFYTKYTSDYYVIGCSFNTCALNADRSVTKDIDTAHNVGAGAVVHSGAMINFIGNRFEWNYINFLIKESVQQLLISDNIFDAATVSHLHIFNKYESIDVSNLDYTINNVVFNSNVISKGAGSNSNKGLGIVSLSNVATRKMRVQISNNNVVDVVGDVVGTERKYEYQIIMISNAGSQNTEPIFNLSNNHFNTEATAIFGVKDGSGGNVLIIDTDSDFGNANHDLWNNIITFRKIEYNGGDTVKIWNTISDGGSGSTEKDKTISLQANGNNRPTLNEASKGFVFFDTAISPARPIWWNGTAWVDATGATV